MANVAFNRKRRIFCGPLEKELRKRLLTCFVWSVVLYGAETWTLWRNEQKQLEAFEMLVLRRMGRVKWTDKIKNAVVLERVGEGGIMLELIRKRKRNWLGHWLRRNCLLKDALEGMVNGKKGRGRRRRRRRRRYEMIDNIMINWLYEGTKKKAEKRVEWRMLNLQWKTCPWAEHCDIYIYIYYRRNATTWRANSLYSKLMWQVVLIIGVYDTNSDQMEHKCHSKGYPNSHINTQCTPSGSTAGVYSCMQTVIKVPKMNLRLIVPSILHPLLQFGNGCGRLWRKSSRLIISLMCSVGEKCGDLAGQGSLCAPRRARSFAADVWGRALSCWKST